MPAPPRCDVGRFDCLARGPGYTVAVGGDASNAFVLTSRHDATFCARVAPKARHSGGIHARGLHGALVASDGIYVVVVEGERLVKADAAVRRAAERYLTWVVLAPYSGRAAPTVVKHQVGPLYARQKCAEPAPDRRQVSEESDE